jgi:hypothetical protein
LQKQTAGTFQRGSFFAFTGLPSSHAGFSPAKAIIDVVSGWIRAS